MRKRFLNPLAALARRLAMTTLATAVLADAALAQTAPLALEQAIQPLRHYYAAINQKDYAAAFAVWEKGEDGKAVNGQSFATFVGGFSDTAYVNLAIGEPGEIEGAAGSSFVEIPVVISATSTDGEIRKFAGSYTMRSPNLAGDASWHIHSAKVKKLK